MIADNFVLMDKLFVHLLSAGKKIKQGIHKYHTFCPFI
jgi:hypothetical protein